MSPFKPARIPPEPEVRARLREAQPNAAVFSHLSESPNVESRAAVAVHPHLFVAGLDAAHRLVHDPVSAVRAALAMNPRLTPAVAMQLADDADWRTRCIIAGRADTHPAILSRLARDHESLVRLQVAEHPRLPAEARARLVRDPQPAVREVASVRRLSRGRDAGDDLER